MAPFVSYAQNLEDVMLWRALGGSGPGCYIDVGAGDPTAESVTKAFYDAGWHGINIEPMPEPFAKLEQERPRDTNLAIALEAAPGVGKYFSVDGGNGLSTGVPELASRYVELGWTVEDVEVEVSTLAEVWERFVTEDVRFLKIDVEGQEAAVLRGTDLSRFRPWILVIESVAPVSTRPAPGAATASAHDAHDIVSTHDLWEAGVVGSGYEFVYFDGLNRYYVAEERAEQLAPAFGAPPNVFDDYLRADEASALADGERLQDEVTALAEDLEQLDARRVREVDVATAELVEVRASLADAQAALAEAHAALAKLQAHSSDQAAELDDAYQCVFELSRHTASLAARVQRFDEEEVPLRRDLEAAAAAADQASTELQAVYATKAWRLIAPLRRVRALLGGR